MLLEIEPTMPRSRLTTLVGVALLATGCATAGPSSDSQGPRGVSGPVTWAITDIGRLVSSDGQRMRWSYTILLKETAGAAIQFEQVERGSYTSEQAEVKVPISFHPGALKYFAEKGVRIGM